jgi:hypothetical protein
MDTCFSAILGCIDEAPGPSIVVNVGNGHTIAALVLGRRIEALYEHHTHELTPEKLESHLKLLARGELDGKSRAGGQVSRIARAAAGFLTSSAYSRAGLLSIHQRVPDP